MVLPYVGTVRFPTPSRPFARSLLDTPQQTRNRSAVSFRFSCARCLWATKEKKGRQATQHKQSTPARREKRTRHRASRCFGVRCGAKPFSRVRQPRELIRCAPYGARGPSQSGAYEVACGGRLVSCRLHAAVVRRARRPSCVPAGKGPRCANPRAV